MTKMAAKWLKSIPYLWPKQLKNHTLWGRTYLYSPYKGVTPPRDTSSALNQFCKASVCVKWALEVRASTEQTQKSTLKWKKWKLFHSICHVRVVMRTDCLMHAELGRGIYRYEYKLRVTHRDYLLRYFIKFIQEICCRQWLLLRQKTH